MNLTLNLILCGVLLACTICVYMYRRWLEDHCDNYIHLHNDSHDATIVHTQEDMCRKVTIMTRLQMGLMYATIAYALVIAGIETYSAWITATGG